MTVAVPATTLPVATASGVATTVATDVGTPTTTVAVPLATAITGVVATTAAGVDVPGTSAMAGAVATGDTLGTGDTVAAGVTAGVAVATTCPDAPGRGPIPPTMLAMTRIVGTARRNQVRVDRGIGGSLTAKVTRWCARRGRVVCGSRHAWCG